MPFKGSTINMHFLFYISHLFRRRVELIKIFDTDFQELDEFQKVKLFIKFIKIQSLLYERSKHKKNPCFEVKQGLSLTQTNERKTTFCSSFTQFKIRIIIG
jgi:hypothetical protein